MEMDRQRVLRCLEVVDAYKASGMKAGLWSAANGVSVRELASWCAHARRWRAWLQGEALPPRRRRSSAEVTQATSSMGLGFVALPMTGGTAAAAGGEVRLQWPMAQRTVSLHWPMSHLRELATWLQEMGR